MTTIAQAPTSPHRDGYYRAGLGLTGLTLLFLAFGIGALGVIGDGGREDRIFLGVFAVVLVGSVLARLRPRGMALTSWAAAAGHGLVVVVALLSDWQSLPGASAAEIVMLNGMYAALFAGAAWLFSRAAGGRAR